MFLMKSLCLGEPMMVILRAETFSVAPSDFHFLHLFTVCLQSFPLLVIVATVGRPSERLRRHITPGSRLQSQNSRQWRTTEIRIERKKCWTILKSKIGSFQVLSDHSDATTILIPTNLQLNPLTLCHRCHLFPGSRRQGLPGTRK